MSEQTTLADMSSVISSPASGAGREPCASPVGPTIDLFGQVAVPVSPFSCAGKGEGTADSRHLWPEFRRLIVGYQRVTQRKLPAIFGEQVASAAGRLWLSRVRDNLERVGYVVGGSDLCAAGIGAPHIRQRLYWMADAGSQSPRHAITGEGPCAGDLALQRRPEAISQSGRHSDVDWVADAERDGGRQHEQERGSQGRTADGRLGAGDTGLGDTPSRGQRIDGGAPGSSGHADQSGAIGGLGDTINPRLEGHAGHGDDGDGPGRLDARADGPVAPSGAWDRFYLVHCRDGKTRRVGSGVTPAGSWGSRPSGAPARLRQCHCPAPCRAVHQGLRRSVEVTRPGPLL